MRGSLRIYLGAAPGVGKTVAMLDEGARRLERGADVVVGYVETHGRTMTTQRVQGLTVVPRRTVSYRDQMFEEMDLPAILARQPRVVLVDELAHTNIPGVENEKRWQDVETLLEAGIDVVSTVNLQHLESVNDVVEGITGIVQRETVPDYFVREAEQIQLVDQTPEALRRRMAHGNIYPAERVDAALSNFFRPGNLAALRELALLWLADRVDAELQEYRERHRIDHHWETRERIVVAIAGDDASDRLLRRGARMASRSHAELVGVHVASTDGLRAATPALDEAKQLLDELGGRYLEVTGGDVAATLVGVARAENATQLLLAASATSRWSLFIHGSVVARCVALLRGEIDLHVVGASASSASASTPRRVPRVSPVGLRRTMTALAIGAVGFTVLTWALASQGASAFGLAISAHLLVVLVVAAVGGMFIGVAAAVVGFLLINYFYAPPVHTFTISDARDVVALIAFVAVALTVSAFVDLASRRTTAAAVAENNARALVGLAQRVALGNQDLTDLVAEVVAIFHLRGAGVVDQATNAMLASHGVIDEKAEALTLSGGVQLLIAGDVSSTQRELLTGVAAQLVVVLKQRTLEVEAAQTKVLEQADALRAALLAAVSHDLRSPLASIKAATTTLLAARGRISDADTEELLRGIDGESDRLNGLVSDLLDMSRIQEGAVLCVRQQVDLTDVVSHALDEVARVTHGAGRVAVVAPETLTMTTDPILVERVIANLARNAVEHGNGTEVTVVLEELGSQVVVRVVDRGPGIAPERRERVWGPIQRAGDVANGKGVGLGLAIAKGLTTVLGGTLDIDETPGGGCTMVLTLPRLP